MERPLSFGSWCAGQMELLTRSVGVLEQRLSAQEDNTARLWQLMVSKSRGGVGSALNGGGSNAAPAAAQLGAQAQ